MLFAGALLGDLTQSKSSVRQMRERETLTNRNFVIAKTFLAVIKP